MADLLLTHGYFLWEDPKEREIMRPYPPLGLLYNSAWLQRAGFSVDLYDSTLGSFDGLRARLAAEPGGVLGIYTTLMTRPPVLRIAAAAQEHGWTVILGGPEAANYPAEYLAHGADVVVFGEGEETLGELLPALRQHGPHRLHGIAGTVFRDEGGRVVRNEPRPAIADLDSLPWPDREAVDLPRYIDLWRQHHGQGSVNLITARGCPYKCNWCSHAVFGYTHRRRDPLDCAAEVQHIRERWQPEQVWYADDVFTISHRWLRDYAAELRRRGLRVPFETISRADRMLQEEVFELLAELGCYRIWIGSESGSQRILDAMQRGVTTDQVQWATKAAQRHGIQVGMFLMWGYEGETVEDIAATVEHVVTANPDVFFTTLAYPIMNTGYYAKVADKVSLPGEWASSGDRDYVVAGRPDRDYYRLADRWLRDAVAAARSSNAAEAAAWRATAATAEAALRQQAADYGWAT
ncbi:MAG: B12-binding domain-containing radical SAM protein [Fimbriimonadaceae bacterium]|nr:B12-binding domain-containing radical SAM protein [Fimbriimonadaceae bacterium]